MSLLRFLLRSPLREALFKAQSAWIRLNDLWLGIETTHANVGQGAHESLSSTQVGVPGENPQHADAVEYGSVDHRNIRKSLDRLHLTPADVFVDIGCGKGRVVCLAARRPISLVVGIELFDRLCEVARQNAERVRGRRSPIEIHCADASAFDCSAGTVFYLFNPFGAQTMREVLANIHRSLQSHPRPIRICYFNPKQEHVFLECSWLKLTDSFHTWGGSRATFWKNI